MRKHASRALLVIWFVCAIGLGTALVALHAPLALSAVVQRPDSEGSSAATSAAPQGVDQSVAGWRATHFIAHGCGCSRDVARHLLARGRLSRLTRETVIFVGEPEFDAAEFRASGFDVETVAVSEVEARHGVSAAPLMRVSDPQGRARYVGGYYETMARTAALDEAIVDAVIAGREAAPLPSWGCALGEALREAQDPLGLKPR